MASKHSSLPQPQSAAQDLPNIIIILFDAFSAKNISLYGYSRDTTPNLAKFAENALVYHSHHSAGNYTIPNTASLLTGTYPWRHRAFNPAGLAIKNIVPNNIFNLLGDTYYHVGYAQNQWADNLLYQFNEYIDLHLDSGAFSLMNNTYYNHLFTRDALYGFRSFDDFLFKKNAKLPESLFAFLINKINALAQMKYYQEKYAHRYPGGLPQMGNYNVAFLTENVIDGVFRGLNDLHTPFCAYLHFFPPHGPYKRNKEFVGKFRKDGFKTVFKEPHVLSRRLSFDELNYSRRQYDELVAQVDYEFGLAIDYMREVGLLDNSYVIVTSDHGEMFERGITGHSTYLLYEPVIHIPLIVSKPKQQGRQDITVPTINVDLLPTLLHLSGKPLPDECEGRILPGLGGEETPERSIFSIEAKRNPAFAPLDQVTMALIKGHYKLIYYYGYGKYSDKYELYDLKTDPEEMENRYFDKSHRSIARELRDELEVKLKDANKPFVKTRKQ